MTDLLGWLANVAFLVAGYSMARKRVLRYAVFAGAGNAGYAIQSLLADNPPLFVLSLALIVFNVWAAVAWRNQ
jgi:hypothetical protein